MKTVLVTGASSGIGKDTAKALIRQGYTVYVAARRIEKMDDLKDLGGIPIKMDITSEEDIFAAVNLIKQQHGGVDILINNAGFASYGTVEETTIDDARYQFEVNIFGLARLTQLVLPYMREKRWGKIVNISSMGGKIYTPLGAWYHATKHALEGWSDCLRLELTQFNIDVIIVEPGAIATELGDVMAEPMMKRSGHGPYAEMTKNVAKMTQQYEKPNASSPPSVISDVILKALRARRPKTRYVAGKMARPIMFIRRWFGDRFYDQLMYRMMR